jgi:phospholipid/cholesterol/gamma-HCH transport system substrate-binding protein
VTRTSRLLALLTGLALVGALSGCGVFGGSDVKTASARFERTVGLYEQSDVRILGVRVGQVTSIEPDGDGVRVQMEYDAKYEVPADAQAFVVAPSIVSDRYVQLSPAYTGGPVLADGAFIDIEDTQVPLELDEVYGALNDLNVALGPEGANKDGALSDLISVSADNLEGNGELLGATLEDFSQAISTLSGQRDDLFGTVNNLQDFTTTIASSDDVVRAFNRDLAVVADQLAGEREDLARAVRQLSVALGDVAAFVAENRESLTTNVEGLADATGALVDETAALEEFLDTAPGALSNLQLAYNPGSGTLDTRDNGPAQAEQSPLLFLCPVLQEGPKRVEEILPMLPAELGERLTSLDDDCREAAAGGLQGASSASGPSAPSALPVPGASAAAPAVPAPRDLTLSGLLMGTR